MNYGLGNAMMQRDGAPTEGLGGMIQNPSVPQQMMAQQQKPQGFNPLSAGLFGILPMLLMNGGLPGILNKSGAPSALGFGGAGQLGGLISGLFKK